MLGALSSLPHRFALMAALMPMAARRKMSLHSGVHLPSTCRK